MKGYPACRCVEITTMVGLQDSIIHKEMRLYPLKGTQPSQKLEDKTNCPQKWAQRGTSKITDSVTSKVIHVREVGVSQGCPARVQDLVESLCGELSLFRKGKVRSAREVLRQRGYILDKNQVLFISQRHKRAQNITTLSSQQMLLMSIFCLGQQIDDEVFCSFRSIFFFQTVFLFLPLEQSMAGTDS